MRLESHHSLGPWHAAVAALTAFTAPQGWPRPLSLSRLTRRAAGKDLPGQLHCCPGDGCMQSAPQRHHAAGGGASVRGDGGSRQTLPQPINFVDRQGKEIDPPVALLIFTSLHHTNITYENISETKHLEAGGGGVEGRDDGGRLALGVVEVVPLSSGRAGRRTVSGTAMVIVTSGRSSD